LAKGHFFQSEHILGRRIHNTPGKIDAGMGEMTTPKIGTEVYNNGEAIF